jgi:hypothetical protein
MVELSNGDQTYDKCGKLVDIFFQRRMDGRKHPLTLLEDMGAEVPKLKKSAVIILVLDKGLAYS